MPPKVLFIVVRLVAVALLTSCSSTAPPRAAMPGSGASSPDAASTWLAGSWRIAAEPTAEVFARAQFGTRQTFTIRRGASAPETNTVTIPFDPKEYEAAKALWLENLHQPEMQWQVTLNPDGTGFHVSALESGGSETNGFRWQTKATTFQLVYTNRTAFHTYDCRIVSSNEWHYPMQPLGGWFVMRRE